MFALNSSGAIQSSETSYSPERTSTVDKDAPS